MRSCIVSTACCGVYIGYRYTGEARIEYAINPIVTLDCCGRNWGDILVAHCSYLHGYNVYAHTVGWGKHAHIMLSSHRVCIGANEMHRTSDSCNSTWLPPARNVSPTENNTIA